MQILQCKTSYLDKAEDKTEFISDESAGPEEADKTLGETACGSDKSSGSLARSSTPNGNLGQTRKR